MHFWNHIDPKIKHTGYMIKNITLFVAALATVISVSAKKDPVLEPSYAWKLVPPLGLREEATIDTLVLDYCQKSVPSLVSPAYATTGNLGAEGLNMIFFERKPMSDFFFRDGLRAWLPSESNMRFYNTRTPMTLLSYNTGGGKENAQDRLATVFSGNINSRAQIGVLADYIYSKGSYDNQATKDLTWGFSGSYIGEKYQFQGYYNHYNFLNKENGGITDDLYITDPAEVQGGSTKVNTKQIPTNLKAAHSRIVGSELYMNHRYNVGFYREETVNDTSKIDVFVPVSSFIWTLKYNDNKHIFKDTSPNDEKKFWKNHYFSMDETADRTSYWSLRNTVGISLLEGFNKYAKAGLSAFATYEIRKFTQTPDTISSLPELPKDLTPLPYEIDPKGSENLMWIGAQLTKQQGAILNYSATGELGIVGRAAGEVKLHGRIDTHIPLFGDTMSVTGYGDFENVSAPYFLDNYISNHFVWKNEFGKTRNLRLGGIMELPFTKTLLNVGVENGQNHIYFDSICMPVQHSGSVQVFSAQLQQNFRVGILNWNNKITYQTSSDQSVIPLPKLAIYSNLYLLFKVAGVMDVQFGIDCDYYSKYKAPSYQPATMAFYNQDKIECGNYPFMNLYANMKLSKARFYVLFSHINQGMTGTNYFSMPHYPLNPRRFQIGISVDFAN